MAENGIKPIYTKELIDGLRKRAEAIGFFVARGAKENAKWEKIHGEWTAKGNDWGGFKYGEHLSHDIAEDGSITFYRTKTWQGGTTGKKYGTIKFAGLSPHKIIKQVNHEPVVTDKEIQAVTVGSLDNTSGSNDATLNVSYTRGSSKTFNNNVGAAFTVGFRQQYTVSAEYSGVSISSETEFSTSVTASYNREWGGEENNTSEISANIVVPAGERVAVTQESSLAKYRQEVDVYAGMEHTVELYSHRDYKYSWNSMADMKQDMMGYGYGDDFLTKRWRSTPQNTWEMNQITKPVVVNTSFVTTFDSANYSEIKVDE